MLTLACWLVGVPLCVVALMVVDLWCAPLED